MSGGKERWTAHVQQDEAWRARSKGVMNIPAIRFEHKLGLEVGLRHFGGRGAYGGTGIGQVRVIGSLWAFA